MSQPALTPGPWRVDPTHRLCIESAAHGNIGIVNLARASEADARLIAAAPDMLAALKQIAKLYAHSEVASEIARNAIAEAEGKT